MAIPERTPNERAALDIIQRRQQGYHHTFKKGDRFSNDVLADLSRFCRANESTDHPDPRVAARLDGRREVWLRIQQHLNLSLPELYELFALGRK